MPYATAYGISVVSGLINIITVFTFGMPMIRDSQSRDRVFDTPTACVEKSPAKQ